jgi:hypothetical protein
MVFNATFNNISVISWTSVLLMEESGEPGENHRPAAQLCDTGVEPQLHTIDVELYLCSSNCKPLVSSYWTPLVLNFIYLAPTIYTSLILIIVCALLVLNMFY